MTTANSLLWGVRNEIARMWKVKDVVVQPAVKPLNFRKTSIAFEKDMGKPPIKPEEQKTLVRKAENTQLPTPPSPNKISLSEITFIGEHIVIEGTLKATEDLLIEGSIQGTIEAKSHKVTIGKKGRVVGDIFAGDVSISGRCKGRIKVSGIVHIARTAEYEGQLNARSLSVEDGAFLKAVIELDRDIKDRQQSSPHSVDAIVFNDEENGFVAQPTSATKTAKSQK
jgi:cytoskeletal protein CcmA (bactofilin family)